jgi:SAM-dependent methyltransferase
MSEHALDCGLSCGLDQCDCGVIPPIDEAWERIFSTRGWGEYPAECLVRFVAKEGRPGMRALEIGCGPGANLWLLAREEISFDAIDGSPSAVQQAKDRLDSERPSWLGSIEVGNFCSLPESFTGYDIAVDSQALCCVGFDAAKAVIDDIYRRMNPVGVFWSRTFAIGCISDRLAGARLSEESEIHALFECWRDVHIAQICRTDKTETIREWIVTARK